MKNIFYILIILLSIELNSWAQQLEWVKSIGNSGSDTGLGITRDLSGNIYITGQFSGTVDFDPSSGVANLVSSGDNDPYFAKYDKNGNYIWAKAINSNSGTAIEYGNNILLDNLGNIYLLGTYQGVADLDPSSETAIFDGSGSYNIFLAKYDKDGNYIWGKSIGASGNDFIGGMVLDSNNTIYITGAFQYTVNFNPSATIEANLTSVNYDDAFIAKYDEDGNYIWAISMGSNLPDLGSGIVLDKQGNIYCTGQFMGTADFDPGSGVTNLTSKGDYDIYFAKYSNDGNLIWAKSMGGSLAEQSSIYMSTDAADNVYVVGGFQGVMDVDPSNAIVNLTSNGSSDSFITKYDANGNYVWAFSFGGTQPDGLFGVNLSPENKLLILGRVSDGANMDPSASNSNAIVHGAGLWDILLASYDTDGKYIWSNSVGSVDDDRMQAALFGNNGDIYAIGEYSGNMTTTVAGTLKNISNNGNYDIYLAKYNVEDCSSSAQTPIIVINNNQLTTTTTGATYQWYLNDHSITTATGNTLTNQLQIGTYQIQTNKNGCTSISKPFYIGTALTTITSILTVTSPPTTITSPPITVTSVVTITSPSVISIITVTVYKIIIVDENGHTITGIDSRLANGNINVYPNPSKGSITIQSENIHIDKIEILNTLGSKMYETNILNDINLQGYATGIYIVKLYDIGSNIIKEVKLLIE